MHRTPAPRGPAGGPRCRPPDRPSDDADQPSWRSMHRPQPGDGDAGRNPTSRAEQALCIVRATRVEIACEQRNRHNIVLRRAAAYAFAFARERFERVDRGGKISLLERDETAR